MRKMLLVIYQNKIQQRAERNNFPLHNHRVTKLSRVASFDATLEFLFLKTGILTIYTVLLNNKVVKRPIKWKIAILKPLRALHGFLLGLTGFYVVLGVLHQKSAPFGKGRTEI